MKAHTRHTGVQPPIVILAAHIIEDISELCTRMAIINRGEILFGTELRRAVEECHEERSRESAVHS